jgi:transketolase
MRQQFPKTVMELMDVDSRLTVLLGDIGVFGFREIFAKHPNNIFNIGILEQATVSMASGLGLAGLIPIIHTIAPFLVERCYEQIKLDFGYQKINGNFVSVGASYDYAALGCSHHCPADIPILRNIPEVSLIVPGTAKEFDTLFKSSYSNGKPNYFRLSETMNNIEQDVKYGKGNLIKKGAKGTVIVVGPLLESTLDASIGLDINIVYFTTVYPFDSEIICNNISDNEKVVVIEPYYSGVIASELNQILKGRNIYLEQIGIPRTFLRNYGSKLDHDKALQIDTASIKNKLNDIFV